MQNAPNSGVADGRSSLKRDSLGVIHVVFFVVAAAAPLTALIGVSPAAIGMGNGIGVPGSFAIAGLLYLLFSVGYTAMSRHIRNAGAFYAYIAQGIGGSCGVGAAFLALLAYASVQIAVYALLGIFLSQSLAAHVHVNVPWWIFSLVAAFTVHGLARRAVEFSGRVLGVFMSLEILIVLVLDAAIILRHPAGHGMSFTSFAPTTIFSIGFGASLAFVVPSFLGFEASAIFSEEARHPSKTIPIATYTAVSLIGLLYTFSTWAIIQAYDPAVVVLAAKHDPANFYFNVSTALLGPVTTDAMTLLLDTSLLAAALALQNTITRYLFALGREGLLWKRLARTHARYQSPHIASLTQTLVASAVMGVFVVAGEDPYATLFSWASAIAAISILVVQTLASVAVVGFFYHDAHGVGLGSRLIAPALSSLALFGCAVAIVINLPLETGTQSAYVWSLPLLVSGICALGIWLGGTLKHRDPTRYYALGHTLKTT